MQECRDLVNNDWTDGCAGSCAFRLCSKLKKLSKRLKTWYGGQGRNSKKAIERLQAEIRASYQSTSFAPDKLKRLEGELRVAHNKEEEYWKAKSRVQWLKEGDKNTKFFHAQTLKRRRANIIGGLEDSDGKWQDSVEGIRETAISYFSELFNSDAHCQAATVVHGMLPRISEEDNMILTAPVSDGEIEAAAFQIPATRAPGPDGYPGCFYQDHWATVGPDVVKVVKAFWHSGRLLRQLNHTNLVLIPKVKCPKNLAQFRPIALCNVVYKIVAKVLANRLKRVIPKVINENQSAFVAGKHIQDNILVVHEILHSLLHQKKGDPAGMAIKLDMAKAYDRVEWDFLLQMMSKMGFDPVFCGWIRECISSTSFSILLNGNPTGYITPTRGLRQGDPLSPYLFLICTEGFSLLIRNGLEAGALHGYRVTPTCEPISHLFFADDSVLFGNATVEEAFGIAAVLNDYAKGSGQKVNLFKSSIFFGSQTKKKARQRIVASLGIQCSDGFGKYLGLQADFGHSKKAVFEEVRNRIENRTAGWAEQFLSQAGKEVLVKAVAMALPNYAMSCFKLPLGVCRDLEKAIRNYWWRGAERKKGMHWISWGKLMRHKRDGGLGFRDIQCFNLAFLAKIGWRLVHHPESLLATVLRGKYFPGSSFLQAQKGKGTSWGWKGIFDARKVLASGLRWRVGNGQGINLREDPWFPKPSTFRVTPRENLPGMMVSDLINPEDGTWRTDLITAGFKQEDVTLILSIPLSKFGTCDRLVWHYNSDGTYTVKSGYGVAVGLLENGDLGKKGRGMASGRTKNSFEWNTVWKLKVPNKIKIFVWKCCNHALAVRHNLQRRNLRVDNVCGVCCAFDETENHVLFLCDLSHKFWFCSPLHLDSHSFVGYDFLASWESFCKRAQGGINPDEIMQEFAFGLWRLWKNRNDSIFKGITKHPLELVDICSKSISEFRGANAPLSARREAAAENLGPLNVSHKTKWVKPDYGTFKVNTDAAWCKHTLKMGVGWVCRDFAGMLHAAGGSGVGFSQSAAAAEAHAIREALFVCNTNGYGNVVIESDAKSVIQMLRKELPADVNLECILGDIEILARSLDAVVFSFVPRECNLAAHTVAKYTLGKGRHFVWDHIGPEFLFNTLASDVNINIRI